MKKTGVVPVFCGFSMRSVLSFMRLGSGFWGSFDDPKLLHQSKDIPVLCVLLSRISLREARAYSSINSSQHA
jgi:hypothetical protein